MKRELGLLAGAVDVDAPRTKRRKELTGSTNHPAEAINFTNDIGEQAEGSSSTGQEGLKEQATSLWQMVKDAVNKECVTKPELSAASPVPLSVSFTIWLKSTSLSGNICSPPFMRLPLKRHYPDYFDVITQPICLDDIKTKIDDNCYPSLDEVRQDFELCFTNAKRYNIKESPIWLDAKFLLVSDQANFGPYIYDSLQFRNLSTKSTQRLPARKQRKAATQMITAKRRLRPKAKTIGRRISLQT